MLQVRGGRRASLRCCTEIGGISMNAWILICIQIDMK